MNHAASRRFVPFGLVALALMSVAANCQQCQQNVDTRRGNLDRVADVVLVTGADAHTYAVSSNPELGHLRVLDLTTERFVEAPNRFFSLSIPVGAETRRLATAPGDDSRVYALDATDRVYVIRTVQEGDAPFAVLGEGVSTGRAPAGLAAFRNAGADAAAAVELWVSLPDEGVVQVLGVDANGADLGELARISLPEGSQPGDVVVDPFGDAVAVADAALPLVHLLRREDRVLDRSLEVGGPISDLAVGVVDVGDGDAPVVLASRMDDNVVVALRLFRPGFPEDRYAVLGSAEVPSLPLVGYVPDQRGSVVVCCRELSTDAVAAGEATDAWAAVASADGRVTYLALAAPGPDGRLVRLIDGDVQTLAVAEAGPSWEPSAGDEAREPTVTIAPTGTYGDPPFVSLPPAGGELTLTWQGDLPSLTRLRGELLGDSFTATVDLQARGARAGDIAILRAADEPEGCDGPHDVDIVAVDGAILTLSAGDDGLSDEDRLCLSQGGQVRVTVKAAAAFTVVDQAGSFLGRLAFEGPESVLGLGGSVLTVVPAADGPPRQTGSTLVVPLDAHLAVVDLDLSDPESALGAGGFGAAAYVPVAMAGLEMDLPGVELGSTIRARRMVIGTGSFDSSGLNTLFACDEAETVPALCDRFR